MADFKKSFDELAKLMLEKAKHKDATLTEITDAFKAMTAYNAQMLKHKAGMIDEGDGFSFADGLGETDGSRVSGRRSS